MKCQLLSLSRFWSTSGCKYSPFQRTLIYLPTLQLQTLISQLPWRLMDSNKPEQPLCTSTLMVHTPNTAPLKGPCFLSFCFFLLHFHYSILSTVEYATTNGCYNEWMLQRTVFINKITMLQQTVFINKIRMLQQMRTNTISWRGTHVRITCQAFLLWLQHQSSSLLKFVRFTYQFSSVICLFIHCIKVKWINDILFRHLYFWFCITFFLLKWLYWVVTLL